MPKPNLEGLIHGGRTLELNGKTYTVKPADAFSYQLAVEAQKTNDLRAMAKIIARSLSTTFEEVYGCEDTIGFSLQDIAVALNAITTEVRAVEDNTPPLSAPAGNASGKD